MPRFTALVLIGCVLASALAIACGGSKSSSSTLKAPTAAPAATTAAVQEINIKDVENGQAYSFDPNQIQVKAGQIVLHYTNPAESSRAHTFQLKTLDGTGDIVKSDEIQPGNNVDFQFTVASAGTYRFLCYRPGHADRGQTGTITVTGSLG